MGELARKDYALLLLADHGQHPALAEERRPGHLGTHDGSVKEDLAVPLVWATSEGIRRALARLGKQS